MSPEFNLLSKLFPIGLLDYFVITGVRDLSQGGCEVELEEKPDIPEDYKNQGHYICHGFHEPQLIHDFPLRGNIFDLRIKRRRWQETTTKQVISRNCNLIADGTSLSLEFATFFKELH